MWKYINDIVSLRRPLDLRNCYNDEVDSFFQPDETIGKSRIPGNPQYRLKYFPQYLSEIYKEQVDRKLEYQERARKESNKKELKHECNCYKAEAESLFGEQQWDYFGKLQTITDTQKYITIVPIENRCKFFPYQRIESYHRFRQSCSCYQLCKLSKNQFVTVDPDRCTLAFYDENGSPVKVVETISHQPFRLAVCPLTSDVLMLTKEDYCQVRVFSNEGVQSHVFCDKSMERPEDLFVDDYGRIIMLQQRLRRVYVFSPMCRFVCGFTCARVQLPCRVVSDGEEEIYICDNAGHCVQVYSYIGCPKRTLGGIGQTNFPEFIKLGRHGELIVCSNNGGFNITIFNKLGELVASLESGVDLGLCSDICLLDDRSLIVSTVNMELHFFKLPLSVWMAMDAINPSISYDCDYEIRNMNNFVDNLVIDENSLYTSNKIFSRKTSGNDSVFDLSPGDLSPVSQTYSDDSLLASPNHWYSS